MGLYVIIPSILIVLLVCWWIFTQNSFISKNNRVKESESAISVMLKQRSSLIPNIVASVQKYVGHENETLKSITEMRSKGSAGTSGGVELGIDLPAIKVLAEQYPELKADGQFSRLIDSLEEMELQIQAARRSYNAAVVNYNNYVQMFPSSIVASSKNYKTLELVIIEEEAKREIDLKNLFHS